LISRLHYYYLSFLGLAFPPQFSGGPPFSQSRAKRTNAVGGGDIDDVESSGPSRLAATAEASTRLSSGDVEAGAVFESGSYCGVGL
jgi:hypothetical protein